MSKICAFTLFADANRFGSGVINLQVQLNSGKPQNTGKRKKYTTITGIRIYMYIYIDNSIRCRDEDRNKGKKKTRDLKRGMKRKSK